MTQSKFRNKISLSAKGNGALKDILSPTSIGVEVESIEAIIAPLHNTKVVIRTDLRKAGQDVVESERYSRRTITYNRIDIATVLPEGYLATTTDIATEVEKLNSLHNCDFTTDDILIDSGKIIANPNSLGYRNAVIVTPPPSGSGQKMDQLTFDAFLQLIPADEPWLRISDMTEIVVVVNGVKNTKEVNWNPTQSPHISLISELIAYVKECANVDFTMNRVINYIGHIYPNEGSIVTKFPVSGGNFTIKNLGTTNLDIGISLGYSNVSYLKKEYVKVLPLMRLSPINVTKSFPPDLPYFLKIELPPAQFYENGVDEQSEVDYTKFKVNGLTQSLKMDLDKLYEDDDNIDQISVFDQALFSFSYNNSLFTNQFGWWDYEGKYCAFIENISEQAMTIEIAGTEYQLGANPLKQSYHIFRKFVNTTIGGGLTNQPNGVIVTINGQSYALTNLNVTGVWYDYETLLKMLYDAEPALKDLVDIHFGFTPYRNILGLYVENKSLTPIKIDITFYSTFDGVFQCLAPTTIVPKGDYGEGWSRQQMYTPIVDVMGDSNPAIQRVKVNGLLYPFQIIGGQLDFVEYFATLEITPDGILANGPMGVDVEMQPGGDSSGGHMRFTPALRPVPTYRSPNM